MRPFNLRSLFAVIVAASAISIAAPAAAALPRGDGLQTLPTFTIGQTTAKHFQNCTRLNRVYPHGVGKPGAVDHVSGNSRPVRNFYVSLALYKANRGSDRDGDKIACERL